MHFSTVEKYSYAVQFYLQSYDTACYIMYSSGRKYKNAIRIHNNNKLQDTCVDETRTPVSRRARRRMQAAVW